MGDTQFYILCFSPYFFLVSNFIAPLLLAGMDTLAAILAALNRVKELDQLATWLMAIR